jgi:hypothetical protein
VKGDERLIHHHLVEYMMAGKKDGHPNHHHLKDHMREIIAPVLFMIAIMIIPQDQEIIKEGNDHTFLDNV